MVIMIIAIWIVGPVVAWLVSPKESTGESKQEEFEDAQVATW